MHWVSTLLSQLRLARRHPEPKVRACAAVVLAGCLGTAALVFSFTPFVTQIGLQFWFLAVRSTAWLAATETWCEPWLLVAGDFVPHGGMDVPTTTSRAISRWRTPVTCIS